MEGSGVVEGSIRNVVVVVSVDGAGLGGVLGGVAVEDELSVAVLRVVLGEEDVVAPDKGELVEAEVGVVTLSEIALDGVETT